MAYVDPETHEDFINRLVKASVVANLGTEKRIPAGGGSVPLPLDNITASKVDAGDLKPVTQMTRNKLQLTPEAYVAIIEFPKNVWDPESEELLEEVIQKGAEGIARQLDAEALDQFSASTQTAVWDSTDVWGSLVTGMRGASPRLDGFAFATSVEADFVGATDLNGRPLFLESPYAESGQVFTGKLLGRPLVISDGVDENDDTLVGVAGGFKDNLFYGLGSQLDILVSKDGFANGRSALDRNLVFVRVELSAAVKVADPDRALVYTVAGEEE